ncbi:MAG TPA: tryptophan synthase subunit alpha [Herpetosiphonaceae bacterium]|nr:tryptophan synthase subunit alpha [Herpetosiphonaceae bacterium]
MSRISLRFQELLQQRRRALIMYLTVGFPQRDSTTELVPAIVEAGADMIELGVPFSDPLADGATVQRATQIALANGVNVSSCLHVVRELRTSGVGAPILLMAHYNPLLQYGLERFCADATDAGVDGLIIPDLPPEEATDLHAACQTHGLDLIFLLAPTSTDERIGQVANLAAGFIYCVALTGTTGARAELPAELPQFLSRVRSATQMPLAVGFGISEQSHARQVAAVADGVIVGSALVEIVEQVAEHGVDAVRNFVAGLRDGVAEGEMAAGLPGPAPFIIQG